MSLTRNMAAYQRHREVLDRAIAAPGPVTLSFQTKAMAIRWRAEAYQLRKLLHDQAAELAKLSGFPSVTPYDTLIIRLVGSMLTIDKNEPVMEIYGALPPATPLEKPYIPPDLRQLEIEVNEHDDPGTD